MILDIETSKEFNNYDEVFKELIAIGYSKIEASKTIDSMIEFDGI